MTDGARRRPSGRDQGVATQRTQMGSVLSTGVISTSVDKGYHAFITCATLTRRHTHPLSAHVLERDDELAAAQVGEGRFTGTWVALSLASVMAPTVRARNFSRQSPFRIGVPRRAGYSSFRERTPRLQPATSLNRPRHQTPPLEGIGVAIPGAHTWAFSRWMNVGGGAFLSLPSLGGE